MMTGRVKWFTNDKGYGFIDFKENEDIFVHYSTIIKDGYKTLDEGQIVEFDLIETETGYVSDASDFIAFVCCTMCLSSICVVVNALRLRRFTPGSAQKKANRLKQRVIAFRNEEKETGC